MILVTGSGGFVGAHLLNRLSAIGLPARTLVRSHTDAACRGSAIPSLVSGPAAETKESCGANRNTESLRLRDLSGVAVSMRSNLEGMG